MNVKIKKNKKGEYRKCWTGTYYVEGKRFECSLSKWKGEMSKEGPSAPGDAEFEASRIEAKVLLQDIVFNVKNGAKEKNDFDRLQRLSSRSLLKAKYNQSFEKIALNDLLANQGRLLNLDIQNHSWSLKKYKRLKAFFEFCIKKYKVNTLQDIKPKAIEDWLLKFREKGLSFHTPAALLCDLRTVFKQFYFYSPCLKYLDQIKIKKDEFYSREIFNSDEIEKLIKTAEEYDPDLKSLIIIASCTGLRLKDICLLKWISVDFKQNTILLKTHKTQGNVYLGMWPLLREELWSLYLKNKGEYVMPNVAEYYLKKNGVFHFIYAFKVLLKKSGYQQNDINIKVDGRSRRVVKRGWHSFRGSFVVAAIRAGVNIDVLKKALGASNVDIIYKHYIKVDTDLINQTFTSKAPAFAGGKPDLVIATNVDRVISLIKNLNYTNLEETKDLVIAMLEEEKKKILKKINL